MGPVDLNDEAQAPNPPAHPQLRRNHSPEIPVLGNRLGLPIKRAPELTLMHASAPPLHRRRGPTALVALSAANGPVPSRSDKSLP